MGIRKALKGTGVALVTPFRADMQIDFPALARLIEHCIQGKLDFLVSLGTTGEAATLEPDERAEVLRFTSEKINGRVPLVAGFGSNDTAALIRSIQSSDLSGISAILSASPAYNRPTQAGIVEHYQTIAAASPLPIIIYNVPSRTASNVEAESTLFLARDTASFIGVKEASADMAQCMEIVEYAPEGFVKLSGDDLLTLPLMSCGFDGVISVIANAYPKTFRQMVEAARSGDMRRARNLHYALKPLMQLIFEEGNPAGIKSVLSSMGICDRHCRLPLMPASADLHDRLGDAMRHLEAALLATES